MTTGRTPRQFDHGQVLWDAAEDIFRFGGEQAVEAWEVGLAADQRAALDGHLVRIQESLREIVNAYRALRRDHR